jgi:hypothetical protein
MKHVFFERIGRLEASLLVFKPVTFRAKAINLSFATKQD